MADRMFDAIRNNRFVQAIVQFAQRTTLGLIVVVATSAVAGSPMFAQSAVPPAGATRSSQPTQEKPPPVAAPDSGKRTSITPRATEPAPPPGVDPAKIKVEVIEEKHPNGKVKSRVEGYHDSSGKLIKHGRFQEWDEAGQLVMDEHYAHDVQHGERKTWYPSGQLQSELNYVNGLEDGTYTRYYANGKPMSVWHMKLGAWDGMYTEYHRTGQKKIEVEFVRGLRQGPQNQWDENGALIQKSDYADGVEQP